MKIVRWPLVVLLAGGLSAGVCAQNEPTAKATPASRGLRLTGDDLDNVKQKRARATLRELNEMTQALKESYKTIGNESWRYAEAYDACVLARDVARERPYFAEVVEPGLDQMPPAPSEAATAAYEKIIAERKADTRAKEEAAAAEQQRQEAAAAQREMLRVAKEGSLAQQAQVKEAEKRRASEEEQLKTYLKAAGLRPADVRAGGSSQKDNATNVDVPDRPLPPAKQSKP